MTQLMADQEGPQPGSDRARQMAGGQLSGQVANNPGPGGMQGLGGLIQGLMPLCNRWCQAVQLVAIAAMLCRIGLIIGRMP